MPFDLLYQVILLTLLKNFLRATVKISLDLRLCHWYFTQRHVGMKSTTSLNLLSQFILGHQPHVLTDLLVFKSQLANHAFDCDSFLGLNI